MNTTLTPTEAALLQAVLRPYLADLRMEIADTDDRTYRQGLHHQHDALLLIATKLDEMNPATEPVASSSFDPTASTAEERLGLPEPTQFTIGSEARCSDGTCGHLRSVVIDPVARTVTDLVIEPTDRVGLGRLVPLDLVEDTTNGVLLRCTLAAFEALDPAEEAQFHQSEGVDAPYGPGQALYWPYYVLAVDDTARPVITDTLPVGEVAVHRGDQVHATDGTIGQVKGLVIGAEDHHVTHVLLEEGHLWGHKEVAIPMRAVSGLDDGIQVDLTKLQVRALPPVGARRPGSPTT